MRYQVELDGEAHELELASAGPGRYLARLGSGAERRELEVTVLGDRPTLAVLIEGRVVELVPLGPQEAAARGARLPARLLDPRAARLPHTLKAQASGASTLKAPMPGRIVKLTVSVGQVVSAGLPALVIEAMKMENELTCPQQGTVTKILVAPGDTVERGAPLIEIG